MIPRTQSRGFLPCWRAWRVLMSDPNRDTKGPDRPSVDFRPRMTRTRWQEVASLSYDGIRPIVDRWTAPSKWSVEGGSGLGRYVYHLARRGLYSVGIEISRDI